MRLAGQHAVVTGAGTGIGAAIASALAAEGASVTLLGRRLEKLEETAHQLRSSRAEALLSEVEGSRGAYADSSDAPLDYARDERGGVFCTSADVSDRAQVEAAFASAREALGPISILVNNAGVAQGAPFAKVSDALWREMMAVNLDGVFHCCQAAISDLLSAEAGRIVTVASMAGLYGFAYAAPYIAAKHGAVGLTRALAAEYARTNLRVNAVCPGFVDSDMTVGSVANIKASTGRSEAEAREQLAKLNPSGRLILPDEVAALVLELVLSDRNGEAVEIA